jgi:hypothetical protein
VSHEIEDDRGPVLVTVEIESIRPSAGHSLQRSTASASGYRFSRRECAAEGQLRSDAHHARPRMERAFRASLSSAGCASSAMFALIKVKTAVYVPVHNGFFESQD